MCITKRMREDSRAARERPRRVLPRKREISRRCARVPEIKTYFTFCALNGDIGRALNNCSRRGREYPAGACSNILSRADPAREIIELQIFEDFKRPRGDGRERIVRFESEALHHKVERVRDRVATEGALEVTGDM